MGELAFSNQLMYTFCEMRIGVGLWALGVRFLQGLPLVARGVERVHREPEDLAPRIHLSSV